MNIIPKLFELFKVSADADLSEDVNFKVAFSNVVNLILLGQSLLLGLHSLFIEDALLASVNLFFSLFFLSYFVLLYVVRNSRYVRMDYIEFVDRIGFFAYFIVAFATCACHNLLTISLFAYPFVAIVLHGRRTGVLLALGQLALVEIYYFFSTLVLGVNFGEVYTTLGVIGLTVSQMAAIFIFYVAVRWLSGLVYDKNREVAALSDELSRKDVLIDRLSIGTSKPLNDIADASNILASERLNPLQTELVGLVRSSSMNALNNIHAVAKAKTMNIPIVPGEHILFNLYSLLSNVLKLYKPSADGLKHTYSVGSNVPEMVTGNSILTRQVLLNIIDSFDNTIGLSRGSIRINVSRQDVFEKGLFLKYVIEMNVATSTDRRNVTLNNAKMVEFFELGVTQRIVESEGGVFGIRSEQGNVIVEVTLRYAEASAASDESRGATTSSVQMNKALPIGEATLLVLTTNDILWAQMSSAFTPFVKMVKRARSGQDTVYAFSNSLIDMVLVDLSSNVQQMSNLVKMIRESESGIARKVPVLALVDIDSDAQKTTYNQAGFDIDIMLPFDEEIARAAVSSFFM